MRIVLLFAIGAVGGVIGSLGTSLIMHGHVLFGALIVGAFLAAMAVLYCWASP